MQAAIKYDVRKLQADDIEEIYRLCRQNSLYYAYCPPMVTEESIKADMVALPPNTTLENKKYVGFYRDGRLIAVMDLIYGYPDKGIAFIGFFMTDISIQGKGIGTDIISAVCNKLKEENYSSVRLAWVKGNPQAEHFWRKNSFVMIKETSSTAAENVILAERIL